MHCIPSSAVRVYMCVTNRWSMRALSNEKRGITSVRGQWYLPTDTGNGAYCMPWFHPSYLLRNPTKVCFESYIDALAQPHVSYDVVLPA
jgi:uracil-DNA glycosylase